MEETTEPPTDLPISNLFDHTASHDAVRIKQSLCHSTGIDLVTLEKILSKFAMPMVEGSPLDLALYVFVSECLHVSIHATSFSLLFSKLSELFL